MASSAIFKANIPGFMSLISNNILYFFSCFIGIYMYYFVYTNALSKTQFLICSLRQAALNIGIGKNMEWITKTILASIDRF